MAFRRIHEIFPFDRLLRFIIVVAVTVQLAVIIYNNFTGYYPLQDFQHFILRLTRGTLISVLAGFLISYPDLYVIRWLNHFAPWHKAFAKRIFLQVTFATIFAALVSTILTFSAHLASPYTEDLTDVLINNSLIYAVINILIMSIFEAWIYLEESTEAKIKTESLKKELAEKAAMESDRKYKELMDFLPQPIFELDVKGNLIYGNKAGYEFFGLQSDGPNQSISVLDLFVKEDLQRIAENIRKAGQGILTEPSEYTAIKRDGTLCPVMVFGSPIIRDDEIVGRRGIIIDISERKRYELRLLKAKEELEQLNASLEQMVKKRTNELTEANTELLKVQKENLQSQFEVLKSQINPHFMFNSLNVLSGLISKDTGRAQQFIDEFSHIYRYVLETLEQPVVSLEKELDFTRSYLLLQQIRYGDDLSYSIRIPSDLLKWVLPPLSLQVVLENAIKHNIVNESKPLKIDIYSEDTLLIVQNNIQPKISAAATTGLGLKNLVKRYRLVSQSEPSFYVETGYYVAKLPLIETE